jgi:hypothetical protein
VRVFRVIRATAHAQGQGVHHRGGWQIVGEGVTEIPIRNLVWIREVRRRDRGGPVPQCVLDAEGGIATRLDHGRRRSRGVPRREVLIV